MIGLFLAAAIGGTAPAPVAPCMWDSLPAEKAAILAAQDLEAYRTAANQLRGDGEQMWTTMAAACGLDPDQDSGAAMAFAYYLVSLWAEQRLADKWPKEKLAAAVDGIPFEDVGFFWLQRPEAELDDAYKARRAAAWLKVYGPFGRTRPVETAEGGDDLLDTYIVGRVGWRIGEYEHAEAMKREAER